MSERVILFGYEIRYAFHSIKRHILLSLSSISAMMISLFLVAILAGIGLTINEFSLSAQEKISIHVVLDQNISQEQTDQLQSQIEAIEGVENVRFSNKDEELELLINEKGEAFSMYRGEDNPLSDAFFVYVQDPEEITSINEQIASLAGVYTSAYGGSTATSFLKMVRVVRLASWIIIAALLLLCLYMVYTAIRSAIESRQEEIAIMRQVGATDGFIRIPFELEGIFYGLCAALPPFVLIAWAYPAFFKAMNGVLFANTFALITPGWMLGCMALLLFGLGIGVGFLASFLAVSRYIAKNR
jgi:cell division transport system permease protein